MRPAFLHLLVITSLNFAVSIFPAQIYVSPSGNDRNDGSIDAPLATLSMARDKADSLKSGTTPVTVYLRGGTYYLTSPVEFNGSGRFFRVSVGETGYKRGDKDHTRVVGLLREHHGRHDRYRFDGGPAIFKRQTPDHVPVP